MYDRGEAAAQGPGVGRAALLQAGQHGLPLPGDLHPQPQQVRPDPATHGRPPGARARGTKIAHTQEGD